MPSSFSLDGSHWTRHHQRIRHLQRWQVVTLAVVCLGSLGLTGFLGRSLLDASARRADSAEHIQRLMTYRSTMRVSETELWRARAQGRTVPLESFFTNFQTFRNGIEGLSRDRAGGDGPQVVAARDRVLRNIREVDGVVGRLLTGGQSLDESLRQTQKPADELTADMDAWISAAAAQGRAAAASGRAVSQRLLWATLGLMGLLGGAGVVVWVASERARVRLAEAIGDSEERFRSLVQNSSDAVVVVDPRGIILYASRSVERLLGYAPSELVGQPLRAIVADGVGPAADLSGHRQLAPLSDGEVIAWDALHRDGSLRHLESIASNHLDDAKIGGYVLNSRDVTDRHEVEAALEYRAFHDPLTDLANRALFEDRVNHALAIAGERRHCLAVLLIDLDDFKTVNDSLGHAAGDALIIEMARRIGRVLAPVDTAGRLGGDEFVVLLESCREIADVERAAATLVETIRRPMTIEGRELVVQASIGIALAGPSDDDAASLLRNADIAMYAAKERGRAGFVVFDSSMMRRATDRLGLVADLHRAIERGEISVAYQPIVSLDDESIGGLEALVRWTHPARGNIEPNAFIHLAEETGQIHLLGQWVLETAMREIGGLEHGGHVSLGVNVSTRQLERDDFADFVGDALRVSGFDPARLVLEITESALMRDPETLLRQLQLLKSLGVTLAIDDFGTGYSSLAYLARLPIDLVKIDRSFVAGVATSGRESRITQMIMGIGGSLALRTIAEGVEFPAQRDALHALGCEYAQGFLFGRPMPLNQIATRLERDESVVSLGSAT